jgi:hypothetical protein
MPITLNLQDVQTELEAIPAGNYPVVVAQMTEGVSKSSNQPMLTAKLRIEGGDFDGRMLFDHFSLQTQALWKLKRFMGALGFGEEVLEDPAYELEPEDFVGMEVTASVIVEPYQGVDRNKVSGYYTDDGPESLDEVMDVLDLEFG